MGGREGLAAESSPAALLLLLAVLGLAARKSARSCRLAPVPGAASGDKQKLWTYCLPCLPPYRSAQCKGPHGPLPGASDCGPHDPPFCWTAPPVAVGSHSDTACCVLNGPLPVLACGAPPNVHKQRMSSLPASGGSGVTMTRGRLGAFTREPAIQVCVREPGSAPRAASDSSARGSAPPLLFEPVLLPAEPSAFVLWVTQHGRALLLRGGSRTDKLGTPRPEVPAAPFTHPGEDLGAEAKI